MKKLLIETNYHPKITLVEGPGGQTSGGNLFVEVVLTTIEKLNGNGRYYSRELWDREIEKFNKRIQAETTETCGELDHPDSQIINLKNVSHAIRKVWWSGDNIVGLMEIFCDEGNKGTSSGRIAGAILRNNLKMGVSSRGMGSIEEVGEVQEVQDDFELLTWDLVSNPSNANSWTKTQLNENKVPTQKWSRINQIITEILCSNGQCPL